MRKLRPDDATRRSWSLIAGYARQRRIQIGSLGLMLLGVTLLQVLNPQIVRYYIDQVVAGSGVPVLIRAAALYLVLALVIQAVRVWAAYIGETVAWGMTNSLRVDLTRHCLDLDYRFHHDHTPGELIERVDGDVTTLAKFLSSALLVIVSNLLLVTGIFISLFFTDWRIGLVLLVYAVVALFTLLRIRGLAQRAWERVRETSANLFGFIGERLSGNEDIRTNRAEGYVLGRLDRLNDQMLRQQRSAMVRSNSIFTIMHGLYLLGYGGALALGAVLYTRGLTSLGTVYLIIAYTNFIYMPLNEVRMQIQDMQRALAGLKRVTELLDTPRAVADGPGIRLPAGPLGVELRQVSLRYTPDGPFAVHDVSLSLAPGEVLGLMGRTGSGKTTLARLMARMYDPSAGAVLLAGQDLTQARVDDLRDRIGLVTQEVQVFRGTVRENVSMFDESVPDERILAAITGLGLGDWLTRLPQGLDTVLESGQSSMSAGEAQLLAICRVFLRDPGLVILDEVSSRLDRETERLLEDALNGLLAGRTGVVIGHRVATVNRADHLVFLEDGRIVESGRRTDLLADNGSRLAQLIGSQVQEVAR